MMAKVAPTGTTSSAWTRISVSTPATGDGTSVSTLSVETSSSGSSTATASPRFLSHRVTVPSVTLSPRAGSTTGVPVPEGAEAAGAAGAGTAGAAGAGAGVGAGVGAGALAESPMTASSPPTATTASSPAVIASNVPVAGEGISVSTLSVDTSSSGSSTVTWSPTFFSQRVTVPSVTLSPSAGIVTRTSIGASNSLCLQRSNSCMEKVVRMGQSCACRGLPARARKASPMASFWVG